jgi:hypothetical protein
MGSASRDSSAFVRFPLSLSLCLFDFVADEEGMWLAVVRCRSIGIEIATKIASLQYGGGTSSSPVGGWVGNVEADDEPSGNSPLFIRRTSGRGRGRPRSILVADAGVGGDSVGRVGLGPPGAV